MADRKFIESLNIEDNVFELKENSTISYLVQYFAPYTGVGEYEIPAGTRFCMRIGFPSVSYQSIQKV